MSSIFLFAQDHGKGESSHCQLQNDLHEKLKEISEQIKRDGVSIPDVLRPLTRESIAQCVISPSHIAFRLEDGQVCRVAYTINSDRLSQKPDRKRKQGMSCSDSSSTVREGVVARTGSTQHGSRSYRSPLNVLGRTSRGISFLREMQRQGIYLARPVTHQIPESEIPEVLIEECQTVLQGKSRQVIVRELQNTNLDVNMAVNNLLSRDDEAEQGNGGGSSDGNAPGAGAGGNSDDWDDEAVELLSFFEYPDSHGLFDADGLIADEMAGPPTSPRFRGDLTSDYEYGFLSDRRKRRRMESHLYSRGNELYSGRNASVVSDTTYNRSVADSLRNSTASDSASDNVKQSGSSTRYYVQLCDVLEFWPDPENSGLNLHFAHITALHSELVALTTWGELHQWRWGDSTPFFMRNTTNLKEDNDKKIIDSESTGHAEHGFPAVYHPRVLDLGLADEKIIKLSGCATRATVLTATGKFATWMDESLIHSLPASYPLGSSSGSLGIEHQAVLFPELRDESVIQIHTAPLVTVIRCLSGSVYWWGIYPSYMRQRAIEKMRQNRVSSVSKRTNVSSKNSGSRRYCLSQQSSSNSTSESSNTSTGEIHAQNVTDISSSSTGIVPGSFVCIRSAPIFHAGAIGFTVVGGVPKVGTLLEDAWKTTDICRFRVNVMNSTSCTSGINESPLHPPALSSDSSQHILTCPYALGLTVHNQHNSSQCSASLGNSVSGVQFPSDQVAVSSGGSNSTLTFQEMPPPPSPASSTCSDQSGPVRVSPGTFKRKKVPSISGDRSERIVGDWDIGNQNNGRGARGRSADRDPSIGVPVNPANKRGSVDLNHDVIDVTTRSDIGCSRASNNPTFLEEDWCLSDVVFVEDGRTQPVGIVLKVDGNIAAVKFLKEQERSCVAANCPYSPVCVLINSILGVSSSLTATTSTFSQIPLTSADPMSWLNDCRLLRKEDLTIVRNAGLVRVPDVVQRTPRRVFAAPSSSNSRNPGDLKVSKGLPSHAPKILALATENSRIHVIAEQIDGGPHQSALYQVYNLSGKLIINQKMPVSASALKPVAELKDGSATITCPSEHPLLLRDPSGLVLSFIPPSRTASHEIWTNLMSLDLPPVQCASFAWIRNNLPASGISGCTNGRQSSKSQSEQQPRCLFGLVVVQDLTLMPHILRANDVQVEKLLAADLSSVESLKVACELADGRRNLLHMAVSMCAPQSNKETSPEWLSKLEPVLTSPIFRPTFEDKTKPIKEANESSDASVMKVVNPNTSSRQPSFWSSVARSSAASGCLSMHELFIRSSIEAATVAAAAALSSSTSRGDSDVRTTSNTAPSSGNGINFWHLPPVRKDELTRRISSYRILRLLVESRHLIPSLIPLLTARNTEDLTPFMLAIKIRAYSVARFLYDTIRVITNLSLMYFEHFLDFFSPASHKLDDSPLFQLCYNDTCSFTWTGPDHIRQDIFECRTCGLMDSLCCCTECARVCHKGHDCRLKRTSPTAYCDCWEKCCCQSLISGFQAPRHELFYKLLSGTKLIHNRNARGEHLLLYLAKCMERQTREQRQHRPSRRRLTSATTRTNSNCNPPPDHDLEPPRFARDAFELALDCPAAVHSMLTLDSNSDVLDTDPLHQKNGFVNEDQVFLSSQGGTNQLDDFVFTLICKCPPEITDILLSTLNRCIISFPSSIEEKKRKFSDDTLPADTPNNSSFLKQCDYPNSVEMTLAAARFIRSVARIYASLSLELAPDQKKKRRPTLLDLCRHVFSSLAPIAINELPVLAASLLVPIRTGTVRPCAPFSFTSQSSEVASESSADAGSRSTSPTWVSWPRTSIFSRLSSRAVSQSSESISTTSNTTDALNSNRDNTNELNTVTTGQSLTNLTSVTVQGRNTSSLLSGRRSVQSVISLLNTSTSATPTLVISSTGNVSNTPAPSETVVTNATSSVTTPTVSTNVGCIMTTQVYLCRTFACLLRVTADLLSEIQGEFGPFSGSLRRCTSVPSSIGLPLTVYDQQRRLPIYCSSSMVATSTTSANNQPHTVVLTPSNTLSSISRPSSSSTDQSSGIRGRLIRSCTTAVSLASGRANTIKVGSDLHCVQLVASVGAALIPVWQWITMAMDNLEAQLRFSASWNAYFPNKNASKSQSKITENQDGASSVRDIPISLSSQVNNETNNRRGHASTFYSRRPSAVANTSSSSTTTNTRLSSNDPITANSFIDSVAVVLGQRQDFLAYLFSIMRTSGGDHGDSVPFIDPQVNKHLAYILDALLYFFRVFESSWPSVMVVGNLTTNIQCFDINYDSYLNVISSTSKFLFQLQSTLVFTADQVTQRNDPFFRRSESILSLSGLGPDLLDAPLSESLPLALQPQLLQPTSGRAELFGCDRFLPMMSATHVSSTRKNDHIPIHMNAMSSTWGERMCGINVTEIPFINQSHNSEYLNPDTQQLLTGAKFLDSVGHSATLLSRWCSALEFFGRHFTPDVGAENGSYIFELGGFSAKEGRFRKQMERLRNVSRRDLVLEVERERGPLILNTIKLLNMEYAKLTSNSIVSGQQPILSCRRIKVTFKDEPGEGSGVARSFFTAFSEAVLSQEPLPNLNLLLQNNSSNSLGNQQPNFHRHYTVLSRSQSNNPANRPTAVLVQSTTSSIFLSTQSITSSSSNTHSPTVLSSSLNSGLSGHQPVPLSTPTTIQSSISFCPYQIQPRLHTFTIGSRGRSSAWRRSGGLSTNAPPFYPSAAQAAFSSADFNSQTSSHNPSPARHSDTSNISHIPDGNVSGTEVLSSRVLDSCASLQLLNSNTNISSGSSPNNIQDPSDNVNRNILLVNYEPSNSIQSSESNNPVCARHDLTNGRSVGSRLFTRIQSLVRNEHLTARITGMLLELPSSEHSVLLTNEEALCNRVDEARALITMSDTNEQNRVERPRTPSVGLNHPVLERLVNWQGVALTVAGSTSVNQQSHISSSLNTIAELIITEDVERVPLFWQPGLQGYYFPRAVPGINLPSNQTCDSVKLAARYSIYRGIGRVIGLCLLTNETCPLHFSRPILKYILGRVVHWHDFAFYDPTTFEGLRQLLLHTSEDFSKVISIRGLSTTDAVRQPNDYLYALVPGGDEVEVNESNVFEFVKKYTEFKMKIAVQEPLEQLRQGVFDVLPRNALDGLTAEDLRLLLNGTGDIDVDVLSGYTTFVDETGTGSNIDVTKSCDNTNLVNRLKKWFWCTVRSMDMKQRQDLLYFWTSSPTLPASAQGFQPMPSITIKPPDDHHLPSANTCISRLYLPLYSSRHILRDKLLQAIGTKSFGFV
ncbi:putative ubiquitin--protein ligase edd [Schistosoma mansoni]|uniref:putative ubiquitin--protein ligase edd n=1 Tax=Schistosoma mansoni TaxID=6183 RepID=UPI00022DC5D4|nr:putative ubiquitin--protein ligase edd [Schistosoma mansoni]|eukprot:XP_018648366.1 putative ubiquitin--protein ligase edd [Schistosoma mansoni]